MSSDTFERPLKTNGRTTFDEFNLKCKVVKFKKAWNEAADNNRQHDAEMIALVFDKMPDEARNFITAWRPEPEETRTYEFAMFIGSPVNAPARGAYQLANKDIREDHIFLMNVAIERQLIEELKHRSGKLSLHVVIYPEDHDNMADDAPDIEKSVDTRFKALGE